MTYLLGIIVKPGRLHELYWLPLEKHLQHCERWNSRIPLRRKGNTYEALLTMASQGDKGTVVS